MAYIGVMKHCILALSLCLAAAPAAADTHTSETEEGFNLMEEGAKMLLRGLLSEMEPSMDELRGMVDEIGPALEMFRAELGPRLGMMMDLVDDFGNYGNPEILPNGDIIIRRNPDAPQIAPPIEPAPDGEIDL